MPRARCTHARRVPRGRVFKLDVTSRPHLGLPRASQVKVSGAAIGLDAGTSYTVGEALPCNAIGDPTQTFDVVRGDQGGFPDAFPIRAPTVTRSAHDAP